MSLNTENTTSQETLEGELSPEQLDRIKGAGDTASAALVALMTGRSITDVYSQQDENAPRDAALRMTGMAMDIHESQLAVARGSVDDEGNSALDRFQTRLSALLSDKLVDITARNAKNMASGLRDAEEFLNDPGTQADEKLLAFAKRQLESIQGYEPPARITFSADYYFDQSAPGTDNALIAEAAWDASTSGADALVDGEPTEETKRVFGSLLDLIPQKSNIVIDMNKGAMEYYKPSDFDKPSESVEI